MGISRVFHSQVGRKGYSLLFEWVGITLLSMKSCSRGKGWIELSGFPAFPEMKGLG